VLLSWEGDTLIADGVELRFSSGAAASGVRSGSRCVVGASVAVVVVSVHQLAIGGPVPTGFDRTGAEALISQSGG
jgi:hypothetical protein